MPAPLTSLPCWYNLLTDGPIPCITCRSMSSWISCRHCVHVAQRAKHLRDTPTGHPNRLTEAASSPSGNSGKSCASLAAARLWCVQDDIDVFSEVHAIVLHDSQQESMGQPQGGARLHCCKNPRVQLCLPHGTYSIGHLPS